MIELIGSGIPSHHRHFTYLKKPDAARFSRPSGLSLRLATVSGLAGEPNLRLGASANAELIPLLCPGEDGCLQLVAVSREVQSSGGLSLVLVPISGSLHFSLRSLSSRSLLLHVSTCPDLFRHQAQLNCTVFKLKDGMMPNRVILHEPTSTLIATASKPEAQVPVDRDGVREVCLRWAFCASCLFRCR